MLVTISKQVTETVELEINAFFKGEYFGHYKTLDHGILQASDNGITFWPYVDFPSKPAELLKANPSTEAEFMNVFNKTMSVINPLVNNAVPYPISDSMSAEEIYNIL